MKSFFKTGTKHGRILVIIGWNCHYPSIILTTPTTPHPQRLVIVRLFSHPKQYLIPLNHSLRQHGASPILHFNPSRQLHLFPYDLIIRRDHPPNPWIRRAHQPNASGKSGTLFLIIEQRVRIETKAQVIRPQMAVRILPQKVVINQPTQITKPQTRITAATWYETRLNLTRLDQSGQISRPETVRLQRLERYQ